MGELERALGGVDAELVAQAQELAALRLEQKAAEHPAEAQPPVTALAAPLGFQPGALAVSTQLRPPAIERFAGDREKSADFATAIDRRLKAVGQSTTFAGLEFVLGHFQGFAATWWRCFSEQHREIRSWAALRSSFLK